MEAARAPAVAGEGTAGGSNRLAILLSMAMFVLVVDTSLMNVSISAVVKDLDPARADRAPGGLGLVAGGPADDRWIGARAPGVPAEQLHALAHRGGAGQRGRRRQLGGRLLRALVRPAFAGAIMLATLSFTFTNMAKASDVLPKAAQEQVADARHRSLQVALLIPILAGLLGLVNSFRMLRLPDPKPSGTAEGMVLG